jgi:dTDP-4-amino-4,6-dideoxygalactose transaminase
VLGYDIDVSINSLTRGFSQGDLITKIRYRPPQTMVKLLWRRLKNCENHGIEQREAKARLLISYLDPEILYPGSKATFHSFWVFPILVVNPNFLMTKLREEGFDATRGNTSLIHLSNSTQYITPSVSINLFQAKQLNEQILYLPVSKDMPEREIIKLAKLLNLYSSLNECEK